jgi:myo-inositol 2-dehydrogenase/D-chiro-inositol 1-dehydrogenase
MPTASRARLAVVGLGRIGRLHADNLATRVRGAELAAVVDAIEPLAQELGTRHGVVSAISFDELGGAGLDGVVIAAPSALHPGLVGQVAAAGLAVFCEKPLGLDAEECATAVATAEAAGVPLQVGFQRRFDLDWRALKAALDAGAIGTVELFRCSHRNAAPPPGAGLGDPFVDLATHDIDAARWVGGEIEEIRAEALPGGDGALLSLRFASGALGAIDVHRNAGYGFECSAELIGSAGAIRCGYGTRRDGTELLRDGTVKAALTCDHAQRHSAAYVAELERFADVATGRAKPTVTGADALAALRLAEEARRSAQAGALAR